MAKKTFFVILLSLLALAVPASAQNRGGGRGMSSSGSSSGVRHRGPVAPSYAWTPIAPLGLHEEAPIDTLLYNYYQRSIPSMISYAYACTGNLGTEGINMLYMERPAISSFFLGDALAPWTPSSAHQVFYNTRIPMTLLSYNTGGSRDNSQDRLQAIFSGNINRKAQIGATLDYLYSKGSYENQAAKHLNWGINGSYIGDRFEFQGAWNHYNMLNKENGGITDDLYIIDPAKLQGGDPTIASKQIPTRLTKAHTKIVGGELYLNSRYKVGYWRQEKEGDSLISREYVPVMSFIWTLGYHNVKHIFHATDMHKNSDFFDATYLNPEITDDRTFYNSFSNTVGVSLLEGFHKYAKFGMAAYVTYEMRKYRQTPDTLDRTLPAMAGLTPLPEGFDVAPRATENLAWVGAQITKQRGSILTYQATGEIGFVGRAAGEVRIRGNVATRLPLFGDTVSITGYGSFDNTAAPYLHDNYLSNHFVWHNDFGMERRLRFGGILNVPWSGTNINVGAENIQNMLYFNEQALPAQHSGSIQVFSATLDQRFRVGILHWDNKITYQTSSNDHVLALPKLAVYSNLYLRCRIATLHLQLGVDCDWYSRYYAPAYQPATATFHNQREMKLGNYPFMNVYANMKLSKVRFYVMMSHINQGWFNREYFSSPHYPLNPRRFQLGLSVDFAD